MMAWSAGWASRVWGGSCGCLRRAWTSNRTMLAPMLPQCCPAVAMFCCVLLSFVSSVANMCSSGCLGAALEWSPVLTHRWKLGHHSAHICNVYRTAFVASAGLPSIHRHFFRDMFTFCEQLGSPWFTSAQRLPEEVPGERGRDVKWFDAAIIAHNGKCAERLTSSTPAQEAMSTKLDAPAVPLHVCRWMLNTGCHATA